MILRKKPIKLTEYIRENMPEMPDMPLKCIVSYFYNSKFK